MEEPITIDNTSFSKPNDDPQDRRQSGAINCGVAIISSGELAVCPQTVNVAQSIAELTVDQRATAYIAASLADSTKKAYAADLSHFLANGGELPTTPETVAQYLATHGESLSPFTLARRLVSISKAHQAKGWDSPTDSELVRSVLRGIRRIHGCEQRRVDPLLREDILAVVDSMLNGASVSMQRQPSCALAP